MINWLSSEPPQKSVMLLGQFDGVHLGHQKLINAAIHEAKKHNLITTALIFDPLPRALITKNFKPIQSHSDRLKNMQYFGINGIYVQKTNNKFLLTTAIDFIKILQELNIATIVVGEDFRFGYKRKGDIKLLEQYFKVITLPDVLHNKQRISSSWCRELILDANFKQCAILLGHPWQFSAKFTASVADRPNIILPKKTSIRAKVIQKDNVYQTDISIKDKIVINNLAIEGFADIIPF